MINFNASPLLPTLNHLLSLAMFAVISFSVEAADKGEWEYGCNVQQRCHTFINGEGIRIAFANEANSTELKGAVVIPTVSSASQPVTLRLDSGVEMRLAVSVCNDQFCEARIDSSKSLLVIEQFLKAKRVTVAYLDKQVIQVTTLSLAGFSSAFRKLDELLNYRINTEIKALLDQWSGAWSKGDVESYLSLYGSSFKNDKFATRSEWIYSRRQKISPEKGINVTVNNVQVALKDRKTIVEVIFKQLYKTNRYSDDTNKQLTFKRNGDTWKIIDEREINF